MQIVKNGVWNTALTIRIFYQVSIILLTGACYFTYVLTGGASHNPLEDMKEKVGLNVMPC